MTPTSPTSLRSIVGSALVLLALGAAAASAQAPSGSTLSPDGLNFLVSKDQGNDRWAVSLNFIPRFAADGTIESYEIRSVSGNVFPLDGGAPTFLFCEPTADSTGDLSDPNSTYTLRCVAAGPCATTAFECAQQEYVSTGDDVQVPTSFFLPPEGLGVTPPPNVFQ